MYRNLEEINYYYVMFVHKLNLEEINYYYVMFVYKLKSFLWPMAQFVPKLRKLNTYTLRADHLVALRDD